jgi:hypothetical protein
VPEGTQHTVCLFISCCTTNEKCDPSSFTQTPSRTTHTYKQAQAIETRLPHISYTYAIDSLTGLFTYKSVGRTYPHHLKSLIGVWNRAVEHHFKVTQPGTSTNPIVKQSKTPDMTRSYTIPYPDTTVTTPFSRHVFTIN